MKPGIPPSWRRQRPGFGGTRTDTAFFVSEIFPRRAVQHRDVVQDPQDPDRFGDDLIFRDAVREWDRAEISPSREQGVPHGSGLYVFAVAPGLDLALDCPPIWILSRCSCETWANTA
jgi:hypothetical protein